MGGHRTEWRLLVHHEDGVLVGGAPVMLTRRGPFRWLHALPWLLPGAPVARPGTHARADERLAAAFSGLAHAQRAVGGSWSFYRPGAPAPADRALDLVPGETRRFEAALLPLEAGLGGVRARRDRKQRQALDRSLDWPYEFAEDPGALDAAYALHLAQGARWGCHRPLPLELSRRLLQAGPVAAPVARLFTLRSAAGLAAATFALDGAHETFVWWRHAPLGPPPRRVRLWERLPAAIKWREAGRSALQRRHARA